jgi:Uma2 family endonuclease
MNVALQKPMTLAEFLDWERRQELRYEFDGFQPVATTGGTIGHDLITFNLRQALAPRLRGGLCRPFGPEVKILVAGRARYPDVFVACSTFDPGAYVVDDAVVVFEVVRTH